MLARKKTCLLLQEKRKSWINFYRNNLGYFRVDDLGRLQKNRSAQFQEKKKG